MPFEDEKRRNHPSFGQVRFNRHSGGESELYGSNIKHSELIQLSISTSEYSKHLNSDWYHEKDKIVSCYMSQTQFAELITSMNMGNGIPCTLNYTKEDGGIPAPSFIGKFDEHKDEYKEKMKELGDKLDKDCTIAFELLNQKGTLKKADKEQLWSTFNKIQAEFGSNSNFAVKCFNEQADKTVLEAKGEVEAFLENKIRSTGIEALKSLKLGNIGKEEIEFKEVEDK